MQKVLKFEDYVNENKTINEMIDPLTLLFAAGFVGYMYGKDIIKAYKDQKILNSDASEILKKINKLQDKKAKAYKADQIYKAEDIQKDIDMFEEKLKSINNELEFNNIKIKDYENDSNLRRQIENEVKSRSKDTDTSMSYIQSQAKKEVKKI